MRWMRALAREFTAKGWRIGAVAPGLRLKLSLALWTQHSSIIAATSLSRLTIED
jgi:NAD(P)-dependent dehydrogenase (short-subunit alcohol dehydrogenase family)